MERVWQKDYANHAEATNDIADYIVGFYNAVRLHSKLGNLSPNAFEREWTSKNLSSCPKLLDHYTSSGVVIVRGNSAGCVWFVLALDTSRNSMNSGHCSRNLESIRVGLDAKV